MHCRGMAAYGADGGAIFPYAVSVKDADSALGRGVMA
jgi:hypothetical protein